jgi:DNA mismatch repair ATPase MutS
MLHGPVGYKYKFHGDDAKIASKELGIAWYAKRDSLSSPVD